MSLLRPNPRGHDFQVVVFAGGWAGCDCTRCGTVGIGACLWQRLFVPCILPRPSQERPE